MKKAALAGRLEEGMIPRRGRFDVTEKPIVEVAITGVDSAFLDQATGTVKIILDSSGKTDLAISMPAKVVSELETKLAEVRDEQIYRSKPQ